MYIFVVRKIWEGEKREKVSNCKKRHRKERGREREKKRKYLNKKDGAIKTKERGDIGMLITLATKVL